MLPKQSLRTPGKAQFPAHAGLFLVGALAVLCAPAWNLCQAAPATAPSGIVWQERREIKNVERVWPSPVDPTKVLVWCKAGLMLSDDDGQTFRQQSDAKAAEQLGTVTDMLVSPANPSVLYAGTLAKGVFRSDDEGKTWTALGSLNEGLAHLRIHSLVFSSDDPTFTTIFATHSLEKPGISFTIDGGKTWRAFGQQYGVADLAVMPMPKPDAWKGGNTLFFSGARLGQDAEEDGFYRTSDGGKMFVRMLNARGPTALVGSRIFPGTAWCGTSSGPPFVTNDFGVAIFPRKIADDDEPSNIASISLGYVSPYTEVVHVYDPSKGVFSSIDGKSWTNNSEGLYVGEWVAEGANMSANASGSVLYACINGVFYRGAARKGALGLTGMRAQPAAVVAGEGKVVTFTAQAVKGVLLAVDLSPIGGPVLPMHDDGRDGDAAAGDGTYTALYQVPADAAKPGPETPKGQEQTSGKSRWLPGQVTLYVTASLGEKSETALVPLQVMEGVQDRILWNGEAHKGWAPGSYVAPGLSVNPSSDKPLSGTMHLRVGIQNGGEARWGWSSGGAGDDTRNYKFLCFYLRSDREGPTDLKLALRDDGGRFGRAEGYRSNELDLSRYVSNVTTRYQLVAIPLADFVLGSQANPAALRELIFIAPQGTTPRTYDLDDIGMKVRFGPSLSSPLAALGSDGTSVRLQARAESMHGKPQSVSVKVDEKKVLALYDDGQHGDGEAGDSIYGATVPVGEVGTGARLLRFAADDQDGSNEQSIPVFLPHKPPARIARWRGNWPPCNGSGAMFENVAPITLTDGRYTLNARMVYDAGRLFLSFEVKDLGFVPFRFPQGQPTLSGLMQGPSVEMWITSPTSATSTPRQSMAAEDHHLVFGVGEQRGWGFRGTQVFDAGGRVTKDGYRVEKILEFGNLNLPNNRDCDFALGKSTRLELRLNTSRHTQLVWSSPDPKSSANPDNWGLIEFGDDAGPPQMSFVRSEGPVLTLTANKALDRASAQSVASYQVNGVQVTKAELDADGRTVRLTAAAPWTVGAKLTMKLAGLKSADGAAGAGDLTFTVFPGELLDGEPFTDYLVSPVQNDVDMSAALKQDLIGENTVRPAAGSKGWTLMSSSTGMIDFAAKFGELENAAIHAHVYLWSDADRKAQLWLGSDDGIKVVLNGAPVFSKGEVRVVERDKDHLNSLQLKQGWNTLLMTVPTVGNGWGLIARLRRADGQPPEGISWQASSPFGAETVGMVTPEAQVRKVAEASTGGVNVEIAGALGWRDVWKISNKSCELVVVPQISRVMHFGLKGGNNVLWVNKAMRGRLVPQDNNDWNNIGGDKIWPTPQGLWDKHTGRSWPPPYYFDACASTAEPIKGGVRLRSPLSPNFGAACIREFVMDEEKPLVYIRQYYQKSGGESVEMAMVHVTQVAKPDFALLPLGPSENGKQYVEMGGLIPIHFQPLKNVLALENDESGTQKVGVKPDAGLTNGWAAAAWGKTLFVASHKLEKDGAYADGGSQVEMFCANAALGSYIQMEILSPVRPMQNGQTLRSDEVWQLATLDAEQARDRDKAGDVAREAHKAALELLNKP